MHQLVAGLSGVEVIADDFVVVGFRDSMEDASVGSRAVWCSLDGGQDSWS